MNMVLAADRLRREAKKLSPEKYLKFLEAAYENFSFTASTTVLKFTADELEKIIDES